MAVPRVVLEKPHGQQLHSTHALRLTRRFSGLQNGSYDGQAMAAQDGHHGGQHQQGPDAVLERTMRAHSGRDRQMPRFARLDFDRQPGMKLLAGRRA